MRVAFATCSAFPIHAHDGTALVQPYLASVDERGETALVFIAGRLSHVLAKRAVLRQEGVAPIAPRSLGVAAATLEDDLVVAGTADAAQCTLAHRAVAAVSQRFGVPLYARVDLMAGDDGAPLLSELELTDPSLYLATAPGASERLAVAIQSGRLQPPLTPPG